MAWPVKVGYSEWKCILRRLRRVRLLKYPDDTRTNSYPVQFPLISRLPDMPKKP